MTAAHCVFGATAITVGFGQSLRTDQVGEFTRAASSWIRHPANDPTNIRNDIALVRLSVPVDMSVAGTLPVLDLGRPVHGAPAFITGWGRTVTGGPGSDQLQGVPVFVDAFCGAWDFSVIDDSTMICAPGGFGRDACQGDSGGPLVMNLGGVLYAVGLVSFNSVLGCETAVFPGVYTRITPYKAWIESITGPLWVSVNAGVGQSANLNGIEPGDSYAVRIRASNAAGETPLTTHVVVAEELPNINPTAGFSGPVCTWLSCSVDGTASSDFDGMIVEYSWNWGDGSEESAGQQSSHTYGVGGTYTVSLTVTDERGGTDTASRQIVVAPNQPPVAAFPEPVCDGLTCSVDGSSSTDGDGEIVDYAWNWGDGVAPAVVVPGSSTPTAAHTYASNGTYEVTLTVIDNGGATAKSSRSITATHKCSGGYYLGELDGQVYSFGAGIGSQALSPPPDATLLDIQSTPAGCGFWLLYSNGNIAPIGDATNLGSFSTTALGPGEHFATFSATQTGSGLWGFTNLGRVVVIGDAVDFGDLPTLGVVPSQDIVDSVALPSGTGYLMLGADGGIFAFPTDNGAIFQGSLPQLGVVLNSPAVGIVPDPDGTGYWIVASDGGAFGFSAPFRGSLPDLGVIPNESIIGMVAFGNGYLQVATDGGVFNFSDQVFSGSLPEQGIVPNTPIIAITPLP